MDQDNFNYGRDQNIFNQPKTVIVNPQPEVQRPPAQQKLLEDVASEVDQRLDQSLYRQVNLALLNLGKEAQPHQVRSPWQVELRRENYRALLPPDTPIAQVFDESQRKLLILGEPGSGKTTTMLDLAQKLVRRAQKSVHQPIPVLLNLSAWKPAQRTVKGRLFDWLVYEVSRKYSLRRSLSKAWLADNQLLLLLDGLDEVAPEHQQACATAMNAWLTGDMEQRPMGLVVCCRIEEYEAVVRSHLYLNGAIALQPLTLEQIETYLTQFELDEVWTSVRIGLTLQEMIDKGFHKRHNRPFVDAKTNENLEDLLSKPLFLSIFGFVASEGRFDPEEWKQHAATNTQREYLFDQYWDATMSRELMTVHQRKQGLLSKTYSKQKLPDRKAVRRTLIFIAQSLDTNTEFLVERMQPSCLITKCQSCFYRLSVVLIGGLVGGLSVVLIGGLIGDLSVVLIGLFIGGLIGGLDDMETTKEIKIPAEEIRRKILKFLRRNLILGPIVLLIGSLRVGLIVGLIRNLKGGIEDCIQPNQGIKNSRNNMLILVGFALLLSFPFKLGLEFLLSSVLEPDQVDAISAALLCALLWVSFAVGGGLVLSQHVALRLVLWGAGLVPLRFDRLLDYCTERLLMQRVGRRYRFVHRLLQEHFAKMELPPK